MQLTRQNSNRERRERDFYPTPIELCKAAIKKEFPIGLNGYVLDPGCGTGNWGNAWNFYNPSSMITGIDIEPNVKYLDCYCNYIVGDFLTDDFDGTNFEAIIGNPPYSLAEEFVRKSKTLLEQRGYIYFLLRLEFLASKKRHFGLFREFRPKKVYVLSRRPSFFSTTNGHTTDAMDYAMFLWQEGYTGDTILDWLYWDYN